MNDIKQKTLEATFKSEFLMERFTRFTREFFNNVKIVSPDVENDHIYAEYKYTIASYTHVATYTDAEKKTMGIFAIKLQNNRSVERSRGIQRNFVSKLLDLGNIDAALVAFYSEDDSVWRLSFVRMDYEFVAGRAKKNLTPAKRYSYLVGKGEPCHTAVEQLFPIFRDDKYNPTIDKIESAFSVQSVTDKFFKEYKDKYLDVKEFLDKSDDFNEQARLHHFTSEQFAKKLMGQIAFLYFIQKKGWLGVKAIPSKINKKEYEKAFYKFGKSSREVVSKLFAQTSEDEFAFNLNAFKDFTEDELDVAGDCFEPEPWGSGSRSFMYDMFEAYDDKARNYFNEFLEPLFYEALNKKRGGNQYYSKLNKRIPFLNGGLFQPLDNYDWKRNDFSIPNFVFSNKKSVGREANGVLDVFSKYNFTVNESEPFESEVAVDPEMLGKIFENLLDVSDRKSKGTFYTPREIVSYMCKESLIYFLANKTGINHVDIEEFILYGEVMRDYDCSKEGKESGILQIPKEVFDHLQNIDEALKDVKIADPAVGSGAFPLGMVNEIVRIRTNITYYMARELNPYEVRLLHAGERHTYRLKRDTIKNSIYAVDIDASAVDITRLRLWLSLVVDDEINPDADGTAILDTAKCDPHTLPNLDCHVLCGNSLIDEVDGVKLFNESILYGEGQSVEWQVTSLLQTQYDRLLQQLFDAQDSMYSADSPDLKEDLKAKIRVITDRLIRINLNPQLGVSKKTIDKYEDGFDIESKPYFLWKLEFGKIFRDNGGFDIVIGNPPYVGEKGNKEIFQNIAKTELGKSFYLGKVDLFYFFFHLALNIGKQKSLTGLITTNYYITASGGRILREDIKTRANVIKIVNFNELKIFHSALGQHNMITFLQKNSLHDTNVETISTMKSGIADAGTLLSILYGKDEDTDYFTFKQSQLFDGKQNYMRLSGVNNIDNPIDSILQKMMKGTVDLGKLSNVNIGMRTGADKLSNSYIEKYGLSYPKNSGIYVITNHEKDNLGLTEYEETFLVPFYKNSDINKYYTEESQKLWLIDLSFPKNKELILESIPKMLSHIKKYRVILENRRSNDNGLQAVIKAGYWWAFTMRQIDFSEPKIVAPQRSKSNVFGYNEVPWYASMDVYFITEKKNSGIYLKYLLALLNSKLYLIWLYNKGKRKGEALELYQQPLSEIPIKVISKSEQQHFIELVDKIIELKKSNKTNKIDIYTKAIDKLVYELYCLTDKEVEMIEGF